MRVQISSRARVQFDSFGAAEQRAILAAVRRAALLPGGGRRFSGQATIRLSELNARIRVHFARRGVLVNSVQRLSK